MKQTKKRRILSSLVAIVLGLLFLKDEQSTKKLSNLLVWSDDNGITVRKRDITITVGNTTTATAIIDHPMLVPELLNTTNNTTTTTTNNNTMKTTNSTTTPHMTIIVQLSGELGNQIMKIAYGIGLQHMVQDLFGYIPPMKFRAQPHAKWKHAMIDTKACFPNVRHYDFQECNTREFDRLQQEQVKYLGKEEASKLELRTIGNNATKVQQALQLAQSIAWKRYHEQQQPQQQSRGTTSTSSSLPHVYADNFLADIFGDTNSFIMEPYYTNIKEFFTLDTKVCKAIPEPDEVVLHIRNFLVEMPRRGKRLGFEELSPNHTATLLLSKVTPGSKIVLVSRFPQHLDPYVQALESQGFMVRVMQNHTGVQDFCFLWKTPGVLVGNARSTYAFLAGLLGDVPQVRLYSVDSLATRAIRGVENTSSKFFQPPNYTNDELKSKFQFEVYPAEDVLNATHTTFETWSDQYL